MATMSQATHASAIRYEPAIDGLRAIAVVAVIVFHLDPRWLPGGFTGVDVFFVISGYLITRILLKEFDAGTFNIWRFYHRRVARIVPALAFVGFTTVIAAQKIYDAKYAGATGVSFIAAICSVANIKLLLQGNYFELSPLTQPFLHCWSLSLEEQFYLFFPVVLGVAWRHSARAVFVTLVTTMIASFVACGVVTPRHPSAAFYLLPFRAWELLAGACIGAVAWRGLPGERRGLARGLAWVGTAGVAVALGAIREEHGFPGWIAVVPVLATVALIAATIIDPETGGWSWLRSRPMVHVGRLSYALYLAHWPVFSLVDYSLCEQSEWVRLGVKMPLLIAASLVLHEVVEAPARQRLLSVSTMRSEAVLLVVAIALVIPIGLALRRKTWLPVSLRDVQHGGVMVNSQGTRGTVALVGDSHAKQYALGLAKMCRVLDLRLLVLSVDGNQPIPGPVRADPPLWDAAVATLGSQRPDVVIVSCNWTRWLNNDRDALDAVVADLRSLVPRLVLITATPFQPADASREAMCRGSRAPFFENSGEALARHTVDRWLRSESADAVEVIYVGPSFVDSDGKFYLRNAAGRFVYFDRMHLNEHGVDLVMPAIEAAVSRAIEAGKAESGRAANSH